MSEYSNFIIDIVEYVSSELKNLCKKRPKGISTIEFYKNLILE